MSRKSLIISKAMELFATNGFGATTVQDITDACGISKGAFYLSFKSKEDLLLALIDDILQDIIAKNNAVLHQIVPAKEKLYQYIYQYLNTIYKHAPFFSIFLREQINPINEEALRRIAEADASTNNTLLAIIDLLYGSQAKTIRYDLVVTINGLTRSYLEYFIKQPLSYDPDALTQFLIEKVDCLVQHHSHAFITSEMWEKQSSFSPTNISIPTKHSALQIIESSKGHYDDLPYVEETLQLLSEELCTDAPRTALVKGLLANLLPYKELAILVYQVDYILRQL